MNPPGLRGSVSLVLLALLAIAPWVGFQVWLVVPGFLVAGGCWAIARGADWALGKHMALLSFWLYVVGVVPGIGLWPLAPIVALILVYASAWVMTGARPGRPSWLELGQPSKSDWIWTGSLVLVTAGALWWWQRSTQAEMVASYRDIATTVPAWVAVVGALLFLVVNGLVEDVIFFGEALATAEDGLTPWVAQIAIATSFGLAHLYGIPNGWIGISMAATWGFVLARLRLKTRGMLATYVTHVCADATIVAMLLPAVL